LKPLRDRIWLIGSTGLSLLMLVGFALLPVEQVRPAWHTLTLAGEVLALNLPLGVFLAAALFRTAIPGRRILLTLLGALLFLPLYLQAAGWDAAFGRQGWYTYEWTSLARPLFQGRAAVVWIHAAALLPWTIAIVGVSLRLVEPELEEAALLDMPPVVVFFRVTLRRVLPAIGLAAAWGLTSFAGEMTVTDMYQVPTYAEELYVGFALGGDLSLVFVRILPGLMLTWLGVWSLGITLMTIDPGSSPVSLRPQYRFDFGNGRWLVFALLLLLLVVVVGIPIGSLVYKAGLIAENLDGHRIRRWSLSRFFKVLQGTPGRFAPEFVWTILIGAATASLTLLLAVAGAWWARRSRWRGGLLIGVAAVGLAIPGPLLSLVAVSFTNSFDNGLLSYLSDRTIARVVVTLAIRVLPLPLLLTWLSLRSIPNEHFELARLEGARGSELVLKVILPQRSWNFVAAWTTAFGLAAGDLSASILVTPPGIFTIPERTFGLLHAGVDDQVAGLCLWTLGIYWLIGAGFYLICRRIGPFVSHRFPATI